MPRFRVEFGLPIDVVVETEHGHHVVSESMGEDRVSIDLEDVLLESHAISLVWEDRGDYSSELECQCGWKGGPSDYGLHLLTVLGLEDRVIEDWRRRLGRPQLTTALKDIGKVPHTYTDQTMPEVTPIQREDYLNIYRDPKNQRRITREKRRQDKLL